ncbi:MAG: MliC family protein [Synergistaceae bacterium]|jgi:membrane-bound inhibitor of C-type lysozyme|nr:MliC family protein [Synergistaceae bacterium]
MTKQIFILASITVATFLASCNQQQKQENTEGVKTEVTAKSSDDIVTQSLTDNAGNKLDMTFDNSKDIVTITFKGKTAELTAQKAASGIWYKNDHLELIGKGNDITLSKDDQVIFKHQDDKVAIEAKSDKGDVLNMTFNNTEGTVKAYLNGGEQIDLVEQKSASGIWYKNDHYELTGKGDKYELQKDGKTVFKN